MDVAPEGDLRSLFAGFEIETVGDRDEEGAVRVVPMSHYNVLGVSKARILAGSPAERKATGV
jgi:hypothetical protein